MLSVLVEHAEEIQQKYTTMNMCGGKVLLTVTLSKNTLLNKTENNKRANEPSRAAREKRASVDEEEENVKSVCH